MLFNLSTTTIDDINSLCYSDQFSGQEITCRGIYLVQSHGGCNADFVYLVAVQNTEYVCQWERFDDSELPKILYSTTSAASNAKNRKWMSDCKDRETQNMYS